MLVGAAARAWSASGWRPRARRIAAEYQREAETQTAASRRLAVTPRKRENAAKSLEVTAVAMEEEEAKGKEGTERVEEAAAVGVAAVAKESEMAAAKAREAALDWAGSPLRSTPRRVATRSGPIPEWPAAYLGRAESPPVRRRSRGR